MTGRKLLAAFLILLASSYAGAQRETGDIAGTVTGPDGKPIELAEIILAGPLITGQRTELTSAQGRYHFLGLPASYYTLDINVTGYKPQRIENVRVQLGATSTIDLKLEASKAVEEQVVVTSRPLLVDTSTATAGIHLSTQGLNNAPTQARTIRDLTKYVPSVTGTDVDVSGGGTGTGQPSFRGQGGYGNNYMVDGLTVTDPRTRSIGGGFNYDALSEVNIISDAFEPQYGQALGGIVNIVTKRGTNNWDGEIAYLGSPDALSGDRFSSQVEVPEIERNNFYGNVGGPIVKDKWHFFASLNRFDNKDGASGREVFSVSGYDPNTGNYFPGTSLGVVIPEGKATSKSWSSFLRMDVPFNAYHHVYLTGQWDDTDTDGGIGALPETLPTVNSQQRRFQFDYKGVFKKRSVLEFKAGRLNRDFSDIPNALGPASLVISGLPQFRNDFNNSIETRKRTDFSLDITHLYESANYGTHNFRAGIAKGNADIDDKAIWTGSGDTVFSVYPADYEDPAKVGLPNPFQGGSQFSGEFVYDYIDADGDTNPDDVNGDTVVNAADIVLNTDASGNPLIRGVSYEQIKSQRDLNSFSNISLYAQDTWNKGRVTVMYGLRADSQEIFNDVNKKVADFSFTDGLAGRFSIQLDLTGDRKNVLKFGAGKFVDLVSTRLGEFTNEAGGLAEQIYLYTGPAVPWTEFQNGSAIPAAFRDPNNWAFDHEQSSESSPATLDEGLRPNSANRYMLEYTHVFGQNKMSLTVRSSMVKASGLIDDIGDYVYMDSNPAAAKLDYNGKLVDDRNGDGMLDARDRYLTFNTINFDSKRRDYKAIEFIFAGNPVKRLELQASMVFSDDKGTNPGNFELGDYGGATGSSNDIGVFGDNPGQIAIDRQKLRFPNDCDPSNPLYSGLCRWYIFEGLGSMDDDEGWYGKLPYAVDQNFKVLASYAFPRDWYVNGFFNWRSGYHWQAKGFQELYGDYFTYPEGRGVRETPSTVQVDLGFGRRFKLPERWGALDFGMQLFNVLGSRTPLSYVQTIDAPDFGQTFSKLDGRTARVTMKYSF